MSNGNYIKLNRSMLNWEWYDDVNVARVFTHLLLTVNYKPKKWHGIEIGRGQRVMSYRTLAEETNLSVQEVRTAIKKLIATGELTQFPTSNYTIVTVENYSKFQDADVESNKQSNTQPNTRATHEQHTSNNNIRKKERKERKEDKNNNPPISPQGELELIVQEAPTELQEPVRDFIDCRKKMKKPFTARALRMMLKKLNEHSGGDTQKAVAIVEQSVIGGWTGIYPLKEQEVKPRNEALEMLKRGVFDDEERDVADNHIFEGGFSEWTPDN